MSHIEGLREAPATAMATTTDQDMLVTYIAVSCRQHSQVLPAPTAWTQIEAAAAQGSLAAEWQLRHRGRALQNTPPLHHHRG